MNRRRAAVPLLIVTLVAALGGTSYAVSGHHHDARAAAPAHHAAKVHAGSDSRSESRSGAPTRTASNPVAAGRQAGPTTTAGATSARATSVRSLLRGSYASGSDRLSGTTKPAVKNKRLPEITGQSVVGGLLVSSPGKWSVSPVQLSYQWFSGGRAVRGATRSTYSPTVKALGARLSVEVMAKKQGYRTATATSAPSSKVRAGSINSLKDPTLSGKAKSGQKLTVSDGKWSVSDLDLTYQWYRGGKAVDGATKSALKLKNADIGKKFYAVVTATRDGYKSASATTDSTRAVTK